MNNLITAAEAFAALQKGKTVLCRPIGDMLDFSDLDQFPASVFGKPGFEFCIKIETIELAGITFTKPLTIDEYEEGQEVYVISTYSPTVYVLDFKTNALIDSINSGFVQRDAENAKLQLKAFSKALGIEINNDLSVIRLGEEPKKQRGKKSKAEPVAKVIPSEVFPADKQPAIVITEQTNVTTSEDLLVPETNEPKVDPEYQKALDALLQRVKESKTPAEVNAVYRYTRTWDDEQMKPILLATHKRLEELEKEKASANEPPSLMVQIQTAPDLTTLDALEIDVAARDPQIQPKLMGYVRKRRYELENPTPTQQESPPDYLLVDGF
jgi:YVTN family beta-propeller protein